MKIVKKFFNMNFITCKIKIIILFIKKFNNNFSYKSIFNKFYYFCK